MYTKRSKQYKQVLKNLGIWGFILILSLEQLLVPWQSVLAQSATPSVTPTETPLPVNPTPTPIDLFDGPEASPSATPTITPTPTPLVNPIADIPDYPTTTPTPTPTIAPDLGISTLRGSANFRVTAVTQNLKRRDFRSIEPIDITVTNIVDPAFQDIQVSLLDVRGNETQATIDPMPAGEGTTVFRIIPPDHIKPGKYTANVFQNDTLISTQSFTWGVLAVNTNKSIYAPNEVAKLQFAVLDESGNMVCDNSQLAVDITDPTGAKKTLSVADTTITVNSECQLHRYTENPDYEATYQTGGNGTYTMNVTATVNTVQYSITDTFEVQASAPFDIERTTATRIYPYEPYTVKLSVVAHQDFSGTITDFAPDNFTITPSNGDRPFDALTVVPFESGLTASDSGYISLRYPFDGQYAQTLGFGEQLFDANEKDLYQQFGLAGHDGTDFALPAGTEVLAADKGKVIAAGPGVYGTTVIIQHTWGRTYYGHFSQVSVSEGQAVAKGDILGLSGRTGLATGPHLHFGMRLNAFDPSNGYYGKIDPMEYLSKSVLMTQTFVQAVSWNVTLKAGEKVVLGYRYKAPEVSPALYFLGPVRLTSVVPTALVLGDKTASSSAQASPSAQLSPIDELLQTGEASGSAVASPSAQFSPSIESTNSAEVVPPESATPSTTIFSEIRRWQIASDQIIRQSVKGMGAVEVNADTQPADFLVEDPQDKQLKSFVVDNTTATKKITYKSLRGIQQQVYKDNDMTELIDNNKLAAVGTVKPQYWDIATETWVDYPKMSELKDDFKKSNTDKKRVKFDGKIQSNLGLGAKFTRQIHTKQTGDSPSMKEDWTLTGNQKKRIVWEIALKDYYLAASQTNVTHETPKGIEPIKGHRYGNVVISAPYTGNMRWDEDAANNTVLIYFEPDGVTGDLVIDPTMSASSTATTVTVTAGGVYKIIFDATTGMSHELYLPDTSGTNDYTIGAAGDDEGWCINDWSLFDTVLTFTTSSVALSENTSTRVKVHGVWTNSFQQATVDWSLYPDRITTNENIHTYTANTEEYKPMAMDMLDAVGDEYKEFDHDTLQADPWTTISGSWLYTNLNAAYSPEVGVVRTQTSTAQPRWYVGYWTNTPRETSITQHQTQATGTSRHFSFGNTSVAFTAGSDKLNQYQAMFKNGTDLAATYQAYGNDYWHPYYTMVTGTKVTSDSGDTNTDGYNEGAGYYSTSAADNGIQVAFSDTRGAATAYSYYNPVIKIANWTWGGLASVEKSTDNGTTWTTLTSGTDYNITTDADEAQVGANIRYFQYLGTASGSGGSTTQFRIKWHRENADLMRHGKAYQDGVYYPFTF